MLALALAPSSASVFNGTTLGSGAAILEDILSPDKWIVRATLLPPDRFTVHSASAVPAGSCSSGAGDVGVIQFSVNPSAFRLLMLSDWPSGRTVTATDNDWCNTTIDFTSVDHDGFVTVDVGMGKGAGTQVALPSEGAATGTFDLSNAGKSWQGLRRCPSTSTMEARCA